MPAQTGRTIRTKKSKSSSKGKKTGKSTIKRDMHAMIEELQKKQIGVDELADTLTDEDVTMLTNWGARLHDEIKIAEKQLEPIKDLLKSYARKTKTIDMSTSVSVCKMSSTTSTETGTPTDLIKLLKKEKKLHLVNDLISVKLGECKKYLGEAFLEAVGFITKKSDPYGKINLKKK